LLKRGDLGRIRTISNWQKVFGHVINGGHAHHGVQRLVILLDAQLTKVGDFLIGGTSPEFLLQTAHCSF